jgi:hypothetical protein
MGPRYMQCRCIGARHWSAQVVLLLPLCSMSCLWPLNVRFGAGCLQVSLRAPLHLSCSKLERCWRCFTAAAAATSSADDGDACCDGMGRASGSCRPDRCCPAGCASGPVHRHQRLHVDQQVGLAELQHRQRPLRRQLVWSDVLRHPRVHESQFVSDALLVTCLWGFVFHSVSVLSVPLFAFCL